MSKHRLPLLADRSIAEAQAERLLVAGQFESKVFAGGRVSCHSGCAHCCYYPLPISVLEGITLYQWLAGHHLWTQKLQGRFQEAKAKTWNLAPEIWLLSMIACPLLEQIRCIAYEARPFLCRTVFSRGDPHYCHPHRLGANLTGILHRDSEVDSLQKAEQKILKRHRLRPITMPFATAVLLGERICKNEIDLEETNTALFEEYTQKQ